MKAPIKSYALERQWRSFQRELAEQFPNDANKIAMVVRHRTAVFSGEVSSEATKAWVLTRFRAIRGIGGIRRLVFRLTVAAPITPAGKFDPFDAPYPRVLPATKTQHSEATVLDEDYPEGTDIVRHPSINAKGTAAPGRRLIFVVDLGLQPDTRTLADPMPITDLDANWTTLVVQVEVFCKALKFESDSIRGEITVRRGATSTPFEFSALVDPAYGRNELELLALFSFNHRHSGLARRSIPVEHGYLADGISPQEMVRDEDGHHIDERTDPGAKRPGGTTGFAAVEREARSPDLTAKIIRASEKSGNDYIWTMEAAAGVGPAMRTAYIDLGVEPGRFSRALREEAVRMRPGEHGVALAGFGERIWERAPLVFKLLYWALRQKLGPGFPIQIITDEPDIPWEMMRPVSPDGKADGHLFLEHPVARWIMSEEGALRGTLPRGLIATFVPVYPTADFALPFAAREGEFLTTVLGAERCTATRAGFLALMTSGCSDQTVAAVHFAGHGEFVPDVGGRIRMTNDWVASVELDQSGVRLGNRDHSLIVFNACDLAMTTFSLGELEGWASTFARRSFGGFVAPLWPVFDEHASDVIRVMMTGLYQGGETLGHALLKGRVRSAASSPTAFAYVCYGDVMARVA